MHNDLSYLKYLQSCHDRLSDIQVIILNYCVLVLILCCAELLYFYFTCSEMVDCFNQIAEDSECRVVVFSGAGKVFTSGKAFRHLAKYDQLLV